MKFRDCLRFSAITSALTLSVGQVMATNGMIMEGYGPISLAMGGAAQAIDNGTAAMMNNPATLQLAPKGTRADLALGFLGPNVTSMGEKSGGDLYTMPAVGWVRKNDGLSYGIGVFGQGGMGTEYPAKSMNAAGTSDPVRSELAVGRVIVPASLRVNDRLNFGATIDFTWASLDMRMAALFSQMAGMSPVPTGQFATMMGAIQQGQMQPPSTVRIDFSDNKSFTGAARSSGFTGKMGMTYQATETTTLGLSYQLKTQLSDMKTGASDATLTMGMAMPGRMLIHNFQMPSVLAGGISWTATPKFLLVADVKRVDWSKVMQNFRMTFESSQGLGTIGFTLPQNWKDQTVLSVGGAYKVTDQWTLRAGLSDSSNPVPDAYVHPLFPAIVKRHLTAGFGYALRSNVTISAAASHAPKVTVNAGMLSGAPITHSQSNFQLMVSANY